METNQTISPARADRAVLIGVLLVMFWMHFSAGSNDFVLDDWTNLKDYGQKPWSEIAQKGVSHPTRPVSLFFVMATFRLFGDHPAAYYALSIACQSVILLLILRLARALGLSRLHAAFAALGFTCWPMLSEMIRWPTMVAGAAACALPAYLAAMVGFVTYCREGGRRRLIWAGAAYAIGIFSYESGIFLPAACLALVARSGWRRVIEVGLTCAGLLAIYAAWRLSNAFGMGTFLLADQFKPDLSFATLFWNAKESVRLMVESVVFPVRTGPIAAIPMLLTGFAILWFALVRRRRRLTEQGYALPPPEAPADQAREIALFGFLWLLAGMIPALVAYTAGRVLYLPMVGVSLALAPLIALANWRPLTQAILGTGILALFLINNAAQRDWIISGQVQRNLRNEWMAKNDEWRGQGKVAIMLVGQMLNAPAPPGFPYQLRQAGFLRGFALENLSFGLASPLPVYLDAECAMSWQNGQAVWHTRFRPEEVLRAPRDNVVIISIHDKVFEAQGWKLPMGGWDPAWRYFGRPQNHATFDLF